MRDALKLVPWLLAVACFCALVLLNRPDAIAAGATCTVTETSAAATDSLALGNSFEPPLLVAGTPITGTLAGTCDKLGANSIVIKFGTGSNPTGVNRAAKCAACAGPSPLNVLQYQIYETNGTTVFPATLTISCSTGTCTAPGGGTYSYNFVGQILQPVPVSSLNDAQIGTYADSLVATATGNGAAAVTTTIAVSAGAIQYCSISTTTNIAFGAYDPLTVAAVTDGTGVVTLTCTRGNSGITMALSGGNNAAHATVPQTRAMIGAIHSDYISYDIFETNTYATRYPLTAVAQTVPTGITTPTTVSLFGQIPAAAQNVSVDTYSDTITATVNF